MQSQAKAKADDDSLAVFGSFWTAWLKAFWALWSTGSIQSLYTKDWMDPVLHKAHTVLTSAGKVPLSFNRTFAKSWKLLTIGQVKAWVLEGPWKLGVSYSVSWVLRVFLWVSLILLFLTRKSWLKNDCLFFFFFFPLTYPCCPFLVVPSPTSDSNWCTYSVFLWNLVLVFLFVCFWCIFVCLFVVVMFNFTRSLRRRKLGFESPCKVLELCFVKPVWTCK